MGEKWCSTFVEFLLGRITTSLDAGTNRNEERTCGAHNSKDSRWIFRGVNTSVLSIQREGDGREEGDAGKY
jgi:hypothetical protein